MASRFRRLTADDAGPGRDLAAALAVAILLGQLLFAQLTLVLVIAFLVVSRISRWRPVWLALPAAIGLGWLLAIGWRPASSGYLAAGHALLRQLAGPGGIAVALRLLPRLLTDWRLWLPGQVPLALIAATAEAALLGLLHRSARTSDYRPGALVAARNCYLTVMLRRGEVATRYGACVGIVTAAGRRAEISWPQARAGVLCTGQDAVAAAAPARNLVLAAIQHRKTVIAIDLLGGGSSPIVDLSPLSAVRDERPASLNFGNSAHYDPISLASPARATNLILAMLDWTGVVREQQLFCASYLSAVLTLIAATPTGWAVPQAGWATPPAGPVDEVLGLLRPGALTGRLAMLPGGRSAALDSLAARAAELTARPQAGQDLLVPLVGQLRELRSEPLGQLLGPAVTVDGSENEPISLRRALAGRAVVNFGLGRPVARQPAAMIARLVVADLIENLADYGDLGVQADCLVWINGCEVIGARQLGTLIELGARSGCAVVLSTPSTGQASTDLASTDLASTDLASTDLTATLAALVNVVTVSGAVAGAGRAGDSAPDLLAALAQPGRPDSMSLRIGRPEDRTVSDCTVVC